MRILTHRSLFYSNALQKFDFLYGTMLFWVHTLCHLSKSINGQHPNNNNETLHAWLCISLKLQIGHSVLCLQLLIFSQLHCKQQVDGILNRKILFRFKSGHFFLITILDKNEPIFCSSSVNNCWGLHYQLYTSFDCLCMTILFFKCQWLTTQNVSPNIVIRQIGDQWR